MTPTTSAPRVIRGNTARPAHGGYPTPRTVRRMRSKLGRFERWVLGSVTPSVMRREAHRERMP